MKGFDKNYNRHAQVNFWRKSNIKYRPFRPISYELSAIITAVIPTHSEESPLHKHLIETKLCRVEIAHAPKSDLFRAFLSQHPLIQSPASAVALATVATKQF
jgi:hypothetical protein